jgi:glycosyltransferase involved in cell wall biosynthesis
VISDVPAHRGFAAEAGAPVRLFPVDDHEALAATLDALLGDPAALAAARARAYALGQERYNWDVEKEKLIQVVVRTLGDFRAAPHELTSTPLAACTGSDHGSEQRRRT